MHDDEKQVEYSNGKPRYCVTETYQLFLHTLWIKLWLRMLFHPLWITKYITVYKLEITLCKEKYWWFFFFDI